MGRPGCHQPYTVNKQGHGPAWSNSLFEDNAEHGMGMLLGYEAVNNMLAAEAQVIIDAGEKYEPSVLTRHIVDIAQAFNRFYHDEHILVDDEREKVSKLAW